MSDYFLAGKKGTTEHAAVWVPDSEASTCMHCLKSKFTALNRRVCMSVINLNDQCCFIDTCTRDLTKLQRQWQWEHHKRNMFNQQNNNSARASRSSENFFAVHAQLRH